MPLRQLPLRFGKPLANVRFCVQDACDRDCLAILFDPVKGHMAFVPNGPEFMGEGQDGRIDGSAIRHGVETLYRRDDSLGGLHRRGRVVQRVRDIANDFLKVAQGDREICDAIHELLF